MTDYLRLAQERAPQAQEEQDNPYLPLAREQQSLQQNRARTVIESALKDDPDIAAERLRLSQTSGIPPDVVQRNLEELRVKERARAIDLVKMAEESPVLYRQLVDPTFATTSVDDLDTLKNIERAVGRGVRYVMGADGKGGLPKDLAGAAVDVGLGATAGVGEMIFNVAGTLYDLVGWQSGAQGMRGFANRSKEARDALGFQPESSTGQGVKSGLQSSGTNLALLPLGLARGLYATANQAASVVAGAMATGVGADAYMRAREQGRTPVQSLTYAIPEATFEYVFERIPASKLFGDIAANTGLLKTIGRQTLSEGWTEQVTTLAQDFNDWMNLNPDKTLAEFINERPEAAYQTFIATLVGVGVQTSTIKGINKIVEAASNQSLVYEQDLFQQQLQLAAASMLRTRSPEQFRTHIQRVVDANEGAKQEIYVDAEVLSQLPQELLAQLPESVREALPSALDANSTVAIPMADVLTVAPGTELEQILNDNARMRPNAPSRVEAELTAQLLQQDAARVLEQAADTAAWQQSSESVKQTILGQLNTAGRFTPDVNEAYATLQANFFSTMAARTGMTPTELYQRYSLAVAARGRGGEVLNAGITAPTVEDFRTLQWDNASEDMVTAELGNGWTAAVVTGDEGGVELSILDPRGVDFGDPMPFASFDEAMTAMPEIAAGRVGEGGLRVGMGGVFNQSATIRRGKETLKKFGLTPGKKYKTREVAAALEARQRAKYGTIAADDRSPEALANIAKWIQAEVEFAMDNPESSGVGWYSEKFQRALDTMAQAFPELAADKVARDTMTALIAITSDGQKVVPNFAQAMDIYGRFRAGGETEGKFTTTRGHQRQASIDNNLAVLQRLYDQMGAGAMHEYLMQEKTISELKKLAKANGGDLKSDYQAHIKMPMAAVEFGPKLGAFYANLMGAHGYLTMDRWWSRTFNRYRGTLLQAPTRQGLDRFKELLGNPAMSDDEAIAATVEPRNAYEAKGFKSGTELEKAANTIYKAAFENLEDAPFNATDRTFMLDAVNKAQKQLARKGYNLSVADIQAILWYYEKRLYGELGARQTADISYEEAAQRVVAGYASGQGVESLLNDAAAAPEDGGAGESRVPVGEEQFDEGQAGELNQSAYHGSPHRGIEKFSTDKIGTGEGAQVYGWGLYFASLRAIGEYYRKTLQGVRNTQKYMDAARRVLTQGENADWAAYNAATNAELMDAILAVAGDGPEAVREATLKHADRMSKSKFDSQRLEADATRALAGNAELMAAFDAEARGQLYEVDIPEDSEMLRWEVPLDQQNAAMLREIAQEEGLPVQYTKPGRSEGRTGRDFYEALSAKLGSDRAASQVLNSYGVKGIKYLGDGSYNYVVFSGDDVAIQNQFYQGQQGARGTFNPQDLLVTLNENADLSTFLHESGHFFLEVMADLASQPDAPQQIKDDMAKVLAWFGVPDLATWNSYTLDQKRPYHERWAESFEQYLFEGQAPSIELQPLFRRFRSWLVNVYKSLTQFMRGRDLKVSDEIRQVMGRLIATDEQIAQAEEASGMLPDFEATNEAIEKLQSRSLKDLKWTIKARDKFIKALTKQAAELRKSVEDEVRAEVERQPLYAAMKWLRKGEMVNEAGEQIKAEKGFRLNTPALAEMYPESMLTRPDLAKLKGMTSKEGLHPDMVADMFGFPSGDALVRSIIDAEPIASVIEGMTDQRMLERHGDLATPEAIADAANEAVHNEARARSLATELKSQAEMLNPRQDTGRTASNGRAITVNAIEQAAKEFAKNIAARRRIKDLRNAAWQHRSAEARAGKRWQDATASGNTQDAVQAKRDQLLNNMTVKALQEAQAEAKKILEFFKRVAKGNDEKVVKGGRDPDVVNAMRAILAAYDVAPRLEKSALEYMELVAKNDPAMYAALKPGLDGALFNAKPLAEMTVEELRGLNDELRAMWTLAKRSRQMEVDGNLLDIEDAADELMARMGEIGIPDQVPGEKGAITDREERGLKLQFAKSILSRVEQWAERLDGKFGGPFLRLVFQPIKDAADRFRTDRVAYRTQFTELLKGIAPMLPPGEIDAREIGYTFGNARDSGMAELMHAILNTGNDSNKRKLLLGRQWASENADGTLDTSRWDAFIQRLIDEGKLRKEHYDFAQGVWDLLEQMKPLAQETHRKVFGRYFAEVTANEVVTPFGTYRGGYVPAQTDSRLVKDAKLRELAEGENESMAYAFPASPSGFTKARVEYNKPLLLDLRALAQHMDKVLLFSHMQGAVTDVRRLLTNKSVSYALDRIDPGAYEGMLIPWLNRAAKQVVETPVVGDRKLSRFLSAARSRAGMSLMFANLSNTVQQITGFSLAGVKVKPGLMLSAAAQFTANPKAMRTAVAEASPYMQDRMLNEVSSMNDAVEDILVNPSLLERGQAWTNRHAYFLQAAVDNTMSPIIWTAAYNQAIEQKMDAKEAVRFADGVIRQTQGSTLPEDISRFESGPGYARLFTQFVSYFNMMANTNATAVKQIADEMGVKKGAGKILYVALAGLLAPIWVAEAIAQAFRGGPEDDEGDGYLDDWLAAVFGLGTVRGLVAMVPIVGQATQLVVNRFNDNPADDKFSLSPAVSLIESAASSPASVYKAIVEDGSAQKAVRDVAAAATLITGLPIFAVARPVGYLAGVADGRIEPTGPIDLARGVVTGTASPESKQP